jgi:hypothetical protein
MVTEKVSGSDCDLLRSKRGGGGELKSLNLDIRPPGWNSNSGTERCTSVVSNGRYWSALSAMKRFRHLSLVVSLRDFRQTLVQHFKNTLPTHPLQLSARYPKYEAACYQWTVTCPVFSAVLRERRYSQQIHYRSHTLNGRKFEEQ